MIELESTIPGKTTDNTVRQNVLRGDAREGSRIAHGDSHDPHSVLGAHAAVIDGRHGVVVRAFHPDAVGVDVLLPGKSPTAAEKIGRLGLFSVF